MAALALVSEVHVVWYVGVDCHGQGCALVLTATLEREGSLDVLCPLP